MPCPSNYGKSILTAAMALWLAAGALQAVTVEVQVLPPYTPHLTDYLGSQNKVLITLRGGADRLDTIRLSCELTGDNGVRIVSDPAYRPAQPIIVNPRTPIQLTGSALAPYLEYSRATLTGVTQQQLAHGAGLPEGNYRLCVRALNYYTGLDLTEGGCSNPFTVSGYDPPQLLYPQDKSEVPAPPTQAMQLSWTRPAGAPADIQYKVKLVEIDSPQRSPADAMASATTPPLLERTVSGTTSLMLGPADPQLVPGKRYALQITAVDPKARAHFRNQGASQIYSFTYGGQGSSLGQVKTKLPKTLFNCGLKGKITYNFADPGSAWIKPLKNTTLRLVVRYGIVSNQPAGYYLLAKEKGPDSYSAADNGKVIAVTTSDQEGNFYFLFTNTDSMGLVAKNVSIGSSEFPTYVGDVYRFLRVEVDDPYYAGPVTTYIYNDPQHEIMVQPGQTQTCDLTAVLRTYPLTVTAVHSQNNKPLSGIIVYVLRKPNTRPANVPDDEGTAPQPRQFKMGMEVVAVDTTGPEGTCSRHLMRLAKNLNPTDRYFIWAESDPGSEKNFTSLPMEYRNPCSADKAVFRDQYEAKYQSLRGQATIKMIALPPKIQGYVHRQDDPNKCIPGATISVMNSDNFPAKLERTAVTSDSGGFQISDLAPGIKRRLVIMAPGFKWASYHPKIDPLELGQKEVVDPPILLEPGARVSGTVVDEDGACVSSRVHIGDLAAVEAIGVKTYNPLLQKWKTVKAAAFQCYALYNVGPQPLVVEPMNQSEFFAAETVMVNVNSYNMNLAPVVVHRKLHRIGLVVNKRRAMPGPGGSPVYVKEPLKGATVTVENLAQPLTRTTDGQGRASFAFKSAGNDFTVRIVGPEDENLVSKTISLSGIPETKTDTVFTVTLDAAGQVVGRVMSQGQPVADAVVRLDEQTPTPIQTVTAQDGTYRLRNLPLGSHTFRAEKPQSNLIGASRTHTVKAELSHGDTLNFELGVSNDMDVSALLGLPISVDEMKTSGSGANTVTKISGRFVNLPANQQFVPDQNGELAFHDVEIVPSSQTNGQGKPLARPKNGAVATEAKTLAVRVYGVVKAVAEDPSNIVISEDGAGSNRGVLKAPVRVDAAWFGVSSIDFPNNRFWLARPDVADPAARSRIPVLAAQAQSLANASGGLLVTGPGGGPLDFTVYGFPAQADPAASTIQGDTVRLATVLHTNLAHVTPSDMALNLGLLKLHSWGLDPAVGTAPVSIPLENWTLVGSNWSLSPQGLVISEGTVKAGMVDIPCRGVRITPTEIAGGDFDLQSLSIKGIIPLKVEGQPYFGYNTGKGHWSLFVLPKPGDTRCASFGGLPGMAPGAKVGITDFYLLSNGEQRFSVETTPLTIYNIATFSPVNLLAYGDYVHIAGYLDLHIPQVPVAFSALDYRAGPTLSIEQFDLQFDAPGVHLSFPPDAQHPKTLGPEGFNAKGMVSEAGKFSLDVNLHHGQDSTAITILPGQKLAIATGGSTRLEQISGGLKPSGPAWGRLWFAGDLKGTNGASGRLTFKVLGEVVAENQSLSVKNLPTSFGGMSLSFDFSTGRLVGFMQIDQTLTGGSRILGAANAVIDGSGWYFISGGQMKLKNPVMEGGALLLFGSHDVTQQMRDLCAQYTYKGKLPASFVNRIEGFYSEVQAEIPLIVPSFDFDFGLVSARLYILAGADMRLGMNFAGPANTYYTGMTSWIEAGAGLGASCVIACAGISASARTELDFNGQYQSNGKWYVDGTGTVTLTGSAYCGWGVCDSDCDGMFCDKEEASASIQLGVRGYIASDGRSLTFFFQ